MVHFVVLRAGKSTRPDHFFQYMFLPSAVFAVLEKRAGRQILRNSSDFHP